MDLLSEINGRIHLELEKAMKKQTENFDSALHELKKRVIKLDHDYDDLEKYGCRLCVRLEDISVEKKNSR